MDRWINDDQINRYLAFLNGVTAAARGTSNALYFSNTYLFTQAANAWKQHDDTKFHRMVRLVPNKDLNLSLFAQWALPVHLEGNHWIMLVVFLRAHVIVVYDSFDHNAATFTGGPVMCAVDVLRAMLITYGELYGIEMLSQYPWLTVHAPFVIPQQDFENCGIFMLVVAEIYARVSTSSIVHGIFIVDIEVERRRVLKNISRSRLVLDPHKIQWATKSPLVFEPRGVEGDSNARRGMDVNIIHDTLRGAPPAIVTNDHKRAWLASITRTKQQKNTLSHRDPIERNTISSDKADDVLWFLENVMQKIVQNVYLFLRTWKRGTPLRVVSWFADLPSDEDMFMERCILEAIFASNVGATKVHLSMVRCVDNEQALWHHLKSRKWLVPWSDYLYGAESSLSTPYNSADCYRNDALYELKNSFPPECLTIRVYASIHDFVEECETCHVFFAEASQMRSSQGNMVRMRILQPMRAVGASLHIHSNHDASRVELQILTHTENVPLDRRRRAADDPCNVDTCEALSRVLYPLYREEQVVRKQWMNL